MLSLHRTRLFLFVILLLFITWPSQALERGPAGTIRVGVFPFEPLNFIDKQGVPQGLYPDLLREIVKDEKWTVEFIPGSWAEGLERLQKGEIDLMLSVAYTRERAELMDFTYESVAELWGQVFIRPEGKSKNIHDLQGQRIAVMREDISGSNFIMTAEKLGVGCEIIEFATHAEVFTAVKNREADAGVAPQHFGLRHTKEYNLIGSSIIFSPFSIFFASKKGTQHELLSHIDAHLSIWKKDPDSFYFNRLNYWLGSRGQNPGTIIPGWLIYASIIGVFAILFFAGFTVLLKRTVRVRTKELRESEAVHRKMIANIGDVIVIIDRNGINRYKSPNIEKWFGWKPEDVVGFNTWVNIHPDDLENGQTFIGTLALTPNASGTTEVRYRCKDGNYKWIEITIVNLLHDTSINGFLGNYQDITERKQSEEALRESDERHRKYLMNAPHGIFVTDEKGRYQQVNPTACNMSGYDEQELLAMSIADLFFEESIEKGLQHFQRVLHQGQSQGELLFRRKNGERRWWSVNVVKISDTQFLGFSIDVTERKQADELIQKRILSLTQPLEYSEIKLEDLFNLDEIQTIQNEFALATGVASIITRTDGTPVTTPSNFTHLCNEIIRKTEQGCANCIKSDAALGRHNPDGPIVQPCLSGGLWDAGVSIVVGGHHIANWLIGQVRNEAQNEDVVRAYAALIGAEEEAFMQAYREVPSMSVERFECVAQALFTLVNQLCNTAYQNVLQARFISERKQAEKEKDSLQAQLTQAQKMEAVGQLAGGVAHDFNNMLGVIIGYSELILEQVDPSQQFHAELKEILKASRRSADLTRQLLTFARKQTVAPRVLDLNQTIEGMFNMLRRLIGENIDLIWMPGSGLWPINMDPSQIDQILANLCVNARDAINGVGKLTVETKNVTFDKEYCATHVGSLSGEYVRIAVSDTGSGMDKETLAHIFEPFFTTKDVGEGTGLGLATVYGAVKQNSGFINAYSEPGQGTTFTIYLPCYVEKTTQAQTTESVKPVLHGDEIIMLVEDEPTLLEMSKTMLERLGYTVLAAGTPSEAIRLAGEYSGQIHLLATDVIMPEMNGRQLSARLLEGRPEMKCLFMSGYTANIIANQGVLKEGVSFIQKPFSKNDLAIKVRDALES